MDAKRRVVVKKYNGKVYIDIREYYAKGRDMLPSKKGSINILIGIYLSVLTWKTLMNNTKKINIEFEKVHNDH